jgi:drug/metabolite transporter (DMT)-like permease
MSWILVAVIAYFLYAIVFLLDKYLLAGPIPSPKTYSFYIGVLEGAVLVLIPFIGFSLPSLSQLPIILSAGAAYILGLLWFYRALQTYEASRITPVIGGMIPVLSMLLIFFISGETPEIISIFALLLLAAGTVLITYKKSFDFNSLKISAITALFWAIHFVLIKHIYLENDFWDSLVWIKAGGALISLTFLFSKEVREGLFSQRIKLSKKTAAVFFLTQGMGATANVLQNWAIALGPLVAAALVPAFQGIQYVFLFVIAVFVSFKFPQLLKEETSKKTILQKALSILLIAAGILLLSI